MTHVRKADFLGVSAILVMGGHFVSADHKPGHTKGNESNDYAARGGGMSYRHAILLVFLFFVLMPALGGAQVITGTVVGTVTDASGAVLPGAVVTVASPSLIGGATKVTTSERGLFRFRALPPGVYELQVRLAGFRTHREQGLRVEVGATVENNVSLSLAEVAEEIFVTAEAPMVDSTRSGVSTNYGSEYVDNLPRLRTDIMDFVRMAPGMSATRPTKYSDVSAFGSGVDENVFLIDGTDQTSSSNGRLRPFLPSDSIHEVELVSMNASAEYGNFQGAVFNIVTRQGGNDWRFDTAYYNQNQTLTSQPVKLDCNCPSGETGYSNNKRHDAFFQVGGPLMRDRLWILGSYQGVVEEANNPGTDPRFPVHFTNHRFFEKLNWQITPRLRLQQTYQDGKEIFQDVPDVDFPPEVGVTWTSRRPTAGFASLTYIMSENTLFEARVAGSFYEWKGDPNGGIHNPHHFDLGTGKSFGGSYFMGDGTTKRVPINAKLTHYAEDFLGATHDFKFGIQFVHGSDEFVGAYPGGASYLDYNGEPLLRLSTDAWSTGGTVRSLGFFVDDTVELANRLTFNLGLRYDRNKSISPDIPEVDTLGMPTGGTTEGVGTIFTWNVISPRLGLTFELSGDGKTLARASWGRFYQGGFAGEFQRFHPGYKGGSDWAWDPVAGDFVLISTWDPLENMTFDPDVRPPRTEQLSLGIDREVFRDSAIGLTYMRKSGSYFTGWEDIGGVYGTDTATLPDGRTVEVFPLLNDPSDRYYLLTNPEDFFLRYDGLLLTFRKRWASRWQTIVSYTLSRSEGLQSSSTARPGNSQVGAGGFSARGRDPNDFINAEGELPNDRTHMFRVQATVDVPKIDVMIGANFQYLSGTPWAATGVVRLPQGSRSIFIEPRGSRRLPSQSPLDLRLSKTFRFRRDGRVELLVDILNALNATTTERVRSTNFFSPTFEEGTTYIWPRRAMLGVKLTF